MRFTFAPPKISKYNWAIAFFAAFGTWAAAYGLADIAGVVGQPSFYAFFNFATQGEPGYSETASFFSKMTGLLMVGAVVGILMGAFSSDYFGRLRTMQCGAYFFIPGGCLQAGAVNTSMMLAGRFFAGVGIGLLLVAIPMYQAEVSPPHARGFIVGLTGISLGGGYFTSAWINFATFFSDKNSSFGWRFPLAFQVAPALVMLIATPFLPRSPRWLTQKGQLDKALEVMLSIHNDKNDPNNTFVRREFVQMRKQVEFDMGQKRGQGKFFLFKTPGNRRRCLLAFFTMFLGQFSGVLMYASYQPLIYASLGLEGCIPLLLTAIIMTMSVTGNTFTSFVVDKMGRKPLFFIGTISILICNICICVLDGLYVGTGTTNKHALDAIVFLLFLYSFCWLFFLDATIWIYISELFPTHLRSEGQAIGTLGFFLAGIPVSIAAPIALEKIRYGYYIIQVGMNTLWVLLIFICPETSNKSLDDIAELFGDKVVLHLEDATGDEIEPYKEEIGSKNQESETVHHEDV